MPGKLSTLEDLYLDLLKDLYSAEKQLVKALPKLAKSAQSLDLRSVFQEHLKQTEERVRRIEHISSEIGSSPRGRKSVGMEGLIEEGNELLQENFAPDVMDAGLVAVVRKVVHFEIASYGTARAWADRLGYERAARLLQETVDEQVRANEKLTGFGEVYVTEYAGRPPGNPPTPPPPPDEIPEEEN